MDVDRSGNLDFGEFKNLWMDIFYWLVSCFNPYSGGGRVVTSRCVQTVFELHAKSKPGVLNAAELQQALAAAGFPLSKRVLGLVVHRYGTSDGFVDFDDFVSSAVKIRCMIGQSTHK